VTIIADRGLFVRPLVQPGRFEQRRAEALADPLDSAAKDPATKPDLLEAKAEVALRKTEIAAPRGGMKAGDALLSQRMDSFRQALDARPDTLLVRLGGLMIALTGLLFAALRLT
jgi:hypothetical protein